MYLKQHAILTLILCIPLYVIFQEKVIIIFLAGFLIDSDHYIEYIFSHKNLAIKKAYQFYIKKSKIILKQAKKGIPHRFKAYLHIFHTIEFYLLILILSFYSQFFILIMIGITFHQILDIGYFIYQKMKYPILRYERGISIIYYLYKPFISK